MLKKLYISVVVLLLAVLSMTVSVFAWFTEVKSSSEANGLNGKIDQNVQFEFDTDYDMLIDTTRFEDLIYVTREDLAKGTQTTYSGLSTNITITIKNKDLEKFRIYVGASIAASLNAGPYTGISNGLLYLVYSEVDVENALNANKNVVDYIMEREIFNFDRTNMTDSQYVDAAISNLRSRNGILISGTKTEETMFIAAWGYYDGLKGYTYNNVELQKLYYSLVYQVTFMLRGGLA
ncbi:hypothetical protein [Haploplasma axanthum]|uniref:Uncharacterized protein n=1 Tax=Haploplasma axanthum TaxID=29552 RepID=A0A449BE94_HAPAX|nr:hypothetical protein [Haploplasma axanthum]VEU80630.1 Uncharacterised protein [Haploplasma axanthum]